MQLSDELQWRGFVNQMTFNDIDEVNNPRKFYFGVDPSADSMTIGNLAAAMMVRLFADYGHEPYLLVGGATGMIGDPDGKKDERAIRLVEDVIRNKNAIAGQYRRLFADRKFHIVDNNDWFKSINYIEFLHKVGKHVSMTQMLDREFVKSRIGEGGSGISYAEFSYSLIQGYDFVHLNREHGVTLQLCGADQWGNSTTGVSLLRKLDGVEAHVCSTPLVVNKSTGQKFGKSEGGAIWLDEKKTSVYQFYQFWLNVDDEGVIDYMKIYTTLDRPTIEAIAENHAVNPGARSAQKVLAREVTDIVHGAHRREAVERVTEVLFGGGDFHSLSDDDVDLLAQEIPTVPLGVGVVEALVVSGVVQSNGEARRMLSAGAISLNGDKIAEDQPVNQTALIRKGKNSFILVSETLEED
ncbi:tyrosine--tRNA ligase [Candidatus Saccharibacteria bacterium 32-49-12]|nr:MAG: tyrosine--tRNA ligase [Candidatus Saccharibacteria bacterium 32-49-12]